MPTSNVLPVIMTSWFIKRESDGQYLRGFSSWDQVDGALIKFFITNILHWLGQVDLCIAEGATEPTSFRVINSQAQITKQRRQKNTYLLPGNDLRSTTCAARGALSGFAIL